MGTASSSPVASAYVQVLERVCGTVAYQFTDPFWQEVAQARAPLTELSEEESSDLEATIDRLCGVLLHNNRLTFNFVQLVRHTAQQLSEVAAWQRRQLDSQAQGIPAGGDSSYNVSEQIAQAGRLVSLVRIFCKHMIEHLSAPQLRAQFSDASPNPSDAVAGFRNGEALALQLLHGMLDFLIDMPVTDDTFLVHEELLNLLLVLLATQMYSPLHAQDHLFFDVLVQQCGDRAAALIHVLLSHFIQQRPAPDADAGGGAPSALWNGMARVVMAPIDVATNLVLRISPAAAASGVKSTREFPLGERSLLLLLVLPHYYPYASSVGGGIDAAQADTAVLEGDPGRGSPVRRLHFDGDTSEFPKSDSDAGAAAVTAIDNPFRDALAALQDARQEGASGNAVPYAQLHDLIAGTLGDVRITLLLFTLLHSNATFLEYASSRPDPGTLVLPLLDMLYHSKDVQAHQLHLLLTIMLILTQDPGFCQRVQQIQAPRVAWFFRETKRLQRAPDLTLAGLIVVVLVSTVQYNLARAHETPVNQNCLAALANLSSHLDQLQASPAAKMVALLATLQRRYLYLRNRCIDAAARDAPAAMDTVSTSSEQPSGAASSKPMMDLEELEEARELFAGFLHTLLEILYSSLYHALPRNPHLLYALLHRHSLLDAIRTETEVADPDGSGDNLVEMLLRVLNFFKHRLEQQQRETWSVGQVMHELQAAIPDYQTVLKPDLAPIDALMFRYVEEPQHQPQEFFTPLIWSIVFNSFAGWNSSRVEIFQVVSPATDAA